MGWFTEASAKRKNETAHTTRQRLLWWTGGAFVSWLSLLTWLTLLGPKVGGPFPFVTSQLYHPQPVGAFASALVYGDSDGIAFISTAIVDEHCPRGRFTRCDETFAPDGYRRSGVREYVTPSAYGLELTWTRGWFGGRETVTQCVVFDYEVTAAVQITGWRVYDVATCEDHSTTALTHTFPPDV